MNYRSSLTHKIVMWALGAMILISPSIVALGSAPTAYADTGQYVRTQSGKVRCLVFANDVDHGGGPLVVCEGGFTQASDSDAVVRANGEFSWAYGINIGASGSAMATDLVLNYGQSYNVNGWTIVAGIDGTRFTNDATGHGMFVSIDNTYPF